MRSLLFPFLIVLFLTANGCASSVPSSDELVVASELSVVNGQNPVLFVGRSPEDGQWILLTDERAPREVVAYALFQDLAAHDSTLNQVRDLPVGWKATRPNKGAPWVRERFSMTEQMTRQESTPPASLRPARRKSPPSSQFLVTILVSEGNSAATRRIMVQDKQLTIWRVEGSENLTSVLEWSDSLKTAVNHTVDSLVQRCGLDTLKDFYGDPSRSNGKRITLSIWDIKKERSTFTQLKGYWVPSLYELCTYINSLLPRRYALDLGK